MGKTYTDFSQLSKGMFRKNDPVVEVKPQPPKKVAGEDALAYFGLNAPEAPTRAPRARADNGRIEALEANVAALRAESAALGAAKAKAERKSANLEQQLAVERQMRASAETERDRLRGEVQRLKNELEEALTAPGTGNGERVTGIGASVREVHVQGLLVPPATTEVFPGEVREHILAVLSEGLEAAQSSERERRAIVLEDVLAANQPGRELERRRRELKQIIKDTGSFVDARTIAALEKIGFKSVSGNKHWKFDYANVRIPISKTPSDRRSAQNTFARAECVGLPDERSEELLRSKSRKRPSNGHSKQVLLMTSQNQREMRSLIMILVAAAGMQASAWTVNVPSMPVSPFADTEFSTNIPINKTDISYSDLNFRFDGTPTNNLELAFGTDANTNGVLEAEEVGARFGWRAGRYFIENTLTGDLFDGDALNPSQNFSVDLHLEVRYSSQQVRKVAVSGVNAAAFGALATNVPPAWIWRRDWNLMRATRRGTDAPSDWIDYSASHRGFAIRLR